MMTPGLENLILSGQAEVRTHNHGVGGVGAIIVPEGKQAIILQIIWHPFVDINGMVNEQRQLFLNSGAFLHTLKIRNKGKKYAFTFRDTFRTSVHIEGGGRGSETIFYPENAKVINTYLPMVQGRIDFDIMRFNEFSQWGVFNATLPASSLEPDPGEGYGNQISTNQFQQVQNLFYYGFTPPPWNPPSYVPPTTQRTNFSSILSNEFEGDQPLVMPPNQFGFPPQSPPLDTDVGMFPMITFTYVILNSRYVPGNTYGSSGIKPDKK